MASRTDETSDEDLVRRISSGDEEAVGELYDRYGGLVYSIARSILSSDESAREVLQDVFMSVWRRAREYDAGRASVSTWIGRLARSRAIDRHRHEHAARRSAATVELEQADIAPDAPQRPDEVFVEAWHAEQAERVRQALAELPPDQRTLIELSFLQGFSQSELAERLGLPLGTVKTRMFRGMMRLRERLAAFDPARGGER